jgi:hypothetical protein
VSADPMTGAVALKPVVQTFIRTTDHLRILDFRTSAGASQRFETTDEHPFWSLLAQEWVPARDLEVGDYVIGPTGEIQHVASTRRDEHSEGVTVYNFEVADYHSYFVQARGARAPPVLVHNPSKYSPNSALSRKTNYGYAIFNRRTGEVLKFGVTSRGFNKQGMLIRVEEQLSEIATKHGVSRADLDSVMLRTFNGRGKALQWERESVGFFRQMGHLLPVNDLPHGDPF